MKEQCSSDHAAELFDGQREGCYSLTITEEENMIRGHRK